MNIKSLTFIVIFTAMALLYPAKKADKDLQLQKEEIHPVQIIKGNHRRSLANNKNADKKKRKSRRMANIKERIRLIEDELESLNFPHSAIQQYLGDEDKDKLTQLLIERESLETRLYEMRLSDFRAQNR